MADAAPPDFVPAIILRNKGVPIEVHRLDENGERIYQGEGDDAEPVTTTLHVRFTSRAVAEIEEAFDGLRGQVPKVERTPVILDGKPLVGEAGPVFTETVVGYEERTFYGVEAFQHSMTAKPRSTLLKALSIALGKTPETLDALLIETEAAEYQNALGVAWSIAQGVDPTEAARILQRARVAVAESRESLASQLRKTMDEAEASTADAPGKDG